MRLLVSLLSLFTASSVLAQSDLRPSDWLQHDLTRPQPERVTPLPVDGPAPVPADATVLIPADGSSLDAWVSLDGSPAGWMVVDGGVEVVPGTGDIRTKDTFGDVQLHVEWKAPAEPDRKSQGKGNSGVFFLDGRYEVQILDTYDNPTYPDGAAGAIYGQYPPLSNPMHPTEEWQAYDIFFRAPRFNDDGSLQEPARITALINGIVVQNNELLTGLTMWIETIRYAPHPREGYIQLQDHGNKVQFRNMWVRETPDRAEPPAGYLDLETVELTDADYDRLAGSYNRSQTGTDLMIIERTDAGLGMSMPWRPGVMAMLPLSPTHFQLANTAATITFDLAEDGIPAGLTFDMGGSSFSAHRVD